MSLKLLTLTLLVSLSISCGKKPEESNQDDQRDLTYSEAEVNFYVSGEIQRCIESNDLNTLKVILKKRSNINFTELGYDGETLLTKAISLGHEEMAKIMINAGADISTSNINNETPLIIAANKGLTKLTEFLVERGADLDKKDIFGDTALLVAIKKKNEGIIIYLLEQGANIFLQDRYGRTPYHLTELYGLKTANEVIKLLLEERFGEPSIEEFRKQILTLEFKHIVRTLTRFTHLVKQYEEINPLSLLSFRNNEEEMIEAAKLFLRWGAKVDGPVNVSTNPPLIDAILNLRYQYVDFLIENHADVNKLSHDKLGPLYFAIELNDPQMVSKLLKRGAQKNNENFNACELAKNLGGELTTSSDKQKNKQIRRILSCGLRAWF